MEVGLLTTDVICILVELLYRIIALFSFQNVFVITNKELSWTLIWKKIYELLIFFVSVLQKCPYSPNSDTFSHVCKVKYKRHTVDFSIEQSDLLISLL